MSTRLAFVLLAACGGGGGGTATEKSAEPVIPVAVPVNTRVSAPTLGVPGVTSTDESPPPVVVLIDGQGQRRLAAAASWKDVGISAWIAGPKTAGNEASHQLLREAVMLDRDPKSVVDGFSDYRVGSLLPATTPEDDPPPPEEEDDESGGTGTAMALEEGKMGRKPSGPSAGPWRGPVFTPGRYAAVVGEVSNAKLEHVPAVVIADPSTKAAVVVKAVTDLEAMIGVWNGDQLRPLRIQFHRDRHGREAAGPWLDVELQPSVKVDGTVVELTKLTSALDDARQRHKLGANATIDVLVGPEVDAQSLVSLLALLDRAGVTSIGLGLIPTEAERKANLPPVVAAGQPNAQGDLDKAIIRRFVKQNFQKITYCYEKELLAVPNLQGTIQISFFITPSGKVASASGAGMNATVASCVAAVIKGIEFPKPKGGGGVQVNYPFTFRPEGANQK